MTAIYFSMIFRAVHVDGTTPTYTIDRHMTSDETRKEPFNDYNVGDI